MKKASAPSLYLPYGYLLPKINRKWVFVGVSGGGHVAARTWLRTRRREPGCVPEEENLVAYQKKRTWLRTRRRDIGCVPSSEDPRYRRSRRLARDVD